MLLIIGISLVLTLAVATFTGIVFGAGPGAAIAVCLVSLVSFMTLLFALARRGEFEDDD